MDERILDVCILGCGSRGRHAYGALMRTMPDKFRIVAVCDTDPEVLGLVGNEWGIPEAARFVSDDEFLRARRGDLLVIATLDKAHYRQAKAAMELGYDLLLEKPITDSRAECLDLLETQRRCGSRVLVCHVLRYAPAFVKVKELLEAGAVGRLVHIQALEQVAFWHAAHSYVRGNWRRAEDTTPMILAKCCHDLDLLQYYAGARAVGVSSMGELTHFTPADALPGATARCGDCPHRDTCTYSATRFYLDRYARQGCPPNAWPYNILVKDLPVTSEKLKAQILGTSPYGRCVFGCDNDVVSHQTTLVQFEGGVTASLTMMGFTADSGRIYRFFGTDGEIVLNETREEVTVKPFGGERQVISIGDLSERGMSHGGGDAGMVRRLWSMITGQADPATSLERSLESHLMGIAAEESRLQGGAFVPVH